MNKNDKIISPLRYQEVTKWLKIAYIKQMDICYFIFPDLVLNKLSNLLTAFCFWLVELCKYIWVILIAECPLSSATLSIIFFKHRSISMLYRVKFFMRYITFFLSFSPLTRYYSKILEDKRIIKFFRANKSQ